jgi:hypothetical protein
MMLLIWFLLGDLIFISFVGVCFYIILDKEIKKWT